MKKTEFIKLVESNETTKALKDACEMFGYEVSGYPYVSKYGEPRLYIQPKERGFRCFKPDLYLHTEFHWNSKRTNATYSYKWVMGTTSYGSLEWEELEKYIQGVVNAKLLYDKLIKIDLMGLEKEPEELED